MQLLLLLLACGGALVEPPAVDPAPEKTTPQPPPTGEEVLSHDATEEAIFVQLPIAGQILASGPVEVRGRAQVWEGRLSVRLLAPGGEVLDEQHVSASVAAPARGDWSATLTPPKGYQGPLAVQAYSSSAKDGSPENVYKVPVVMR